MQLSLGVAPPAHEPIQSPSHPPVDRVSGLLASRAALHHPFGKAGAQLARPAPSKGPFPFDVASYAPCALLN